MIYGMEDLVAEFHRTARKPGSAGGCKTCESPHRELVERLMRDGGGSGNISLFLKRKFNVVIGESSLRRHKREHMDAPEY